MTDDEKSFRERVEEIREKRAQEDDEQQQDQSEEKTFRDRVEEIREQRAEQERNADAVNSNMDDVSAGTQDAESELPIPDMEPFLAQIGTELSASRIVVETDTEELEFTDQSLYKTQTAHGPLYQVLGEPDKIQPITEKSKPHQREGEQSNSGTRVFTADSNNSRMNESGTQSLEIEFCPSCGTNLESFSDLQYCPSCGREI